MGPVGAGRVSRHVTVVCSHCGRAAAEVALLPAEVPGAEPWSQGDRLERTDFLGAVTKFGAYDALRPLFDLVARGDFDAARGADADFVAFYCRACRRVYCDRCWGAHRLEFDEGFYDCTYATCPRGHEQVIDD